MKQRVQRNWKTAKLFASSFALTFALIGLTPIESAAEIKITGVVNASNVIISETNGYQIYGGMAGSCSSDGGTCSSCTTDDATACNPARIDPSRTELQITFTSTSLTTGYVLLKKSGSGGKKPILVEPTTFSGGAGTLRVLWGDLCEALDGTAADCLTTTSVEEFEIGVSQTSSPTDFGENDDKGTIRVQVVNIDTALNDIDECENVIEGDIGVCSFEAYPGDEKIYVEKTTLDLLFPKAQSSRVDVDLIRVFYAPGDEILDENGKPDLTQIHQAQLRSGQYTDLTFTVEGKDVDISDPEVTGLSNGVTYGFRTAVVDVAGNVFGWLSNAALGVQCPALTPPCSLYATPDEVLGLLPEDFNCFVATAAFGSNLHPRLPILRNFRNQFLLTTDWGRAFVKKYYQWGPYAARYIEAHPSLKPVVRTLLWPAWVFAELSLQLGLFWSLLASTFLGLSLVFLIKKIVHFYLAPSLARELK